MFHFARFLRWTLFFMFLSLILAGCLQPESMKAITDIAGCLANAMHSVKVLSDKTAASSMPIATHAPALRNTPDMAEPSPAYLPTDAGCVSPMTMRSLLPGECWCKVLQGVVTSTPDCPSDMGR